MTGAIATFAAVHYYSMLSNNFIVQTNKEISPYHAVHRNERHVVSYAPDKATDLLHAAVAGQFLDYSEC